MTAALPGRLAIVIVVSAYPPHHKGGYELRCRDVATELAKRGHAVTVLTTRPPASAGRVRSVETVDGVRVVRTLHAWPDGVRGRQGIASLILGSWADCRRLRREMRRSDVVAYWHQSGLSSALLAVRRPRRCGVLCDVSSEWLSVSVTGSPLRLVPATVAVLTNGSGSVPMTGRVAEKSQVSPSSSNRSPSSPRDVGRRARKVVGHRHGGNGRAVAAGSV